MPKTAARFTQRRSSFFIGICGAVSIFVALLLSAAWAQSQQVQPPPTPPSGQSDQEKPSAKQSTQLPRPALRVLSQLVQVDVIAKDHNGKPVDDLKQSDFSVYEDGKKQEITWFSLETDKTRENPSRTLEATPDTYSNLLEQKTGVPGNLTILLLDYLNTAHSDMVFGREQVMKLLRQMHPQDRVAIYALSGRLYVLHDFTSDKSALEHSVRSFESAESGDYVDSQLKPQYTGDVNGDDAMVNQFNQNLSDFANIDRAYTTTQVFEIIAQHMMRIPGRKNLVWISSSFPFSIGLDKEGDNSNSSPFRNGAAVPFGVRPNAFNLGQAGHAGPGEGPQGLFMRESRDFHEEIDRAVRALAGSNIALYPVDPRGLIGDFGTDPRFNAAGNMGPLTVSNANFSLADFAPNIDTMRNLADRTGGQAYYNTNDIGGSVRKAIEDSRMSYMLSYYPPQDNGRGDFHKIRVKVNRPGIDLRYRTGYLAKTLNFTGITDNSKLIREVLFSPLDATGLGMTVHVNPFDKGGKRTLNLIIALEERDLTFHPGDNRTLGNIQVVLAQFDAEGKEISGETSRVDMRLLKETYEKVRRNGLHFGRNLALSSAATELRVLACDDKTGAIGSVSIPLGKYFPPAGR